MPSRRLPLGSVPVADISLTPLLFLQSWRLVGALSLFRRGGPLKLWSDCYPFKEDSNGWWQWPRKPRFYAFHIPPANPEKPYELPAAVIP